MIINGIRRQSKKNTWVLLIAIIFIAVVTICVLVLAIYVPFDGEKISADQYSEGSVVESKKTELGDNSTKSSTSLVIKTGSEVTEKTTPATGKKNELDNKAFNIIKERCANCHSAKPTSNMFASAPLGITFDDGQQIVTQATRIFQRTVVLKTMPFANMTKMTEGERAILGEWYESLLKK